VLSLSDGQEIWFGAVGGASGQLRNPVIIGKRLYVMDDNALVALTSP
jgi:hypothetical protein